MAEDVFGIVGSVIASAYHVESVVAEGGFGVVYRAHHGGLRAPVALKLLKVPQQSPRQQAAFLELFRSEAELLFRLSASLPTVVRALHVDSFTSKDGRFVPYLVFEWLDGMTLNALIRERNRTNLPPVSLRKLVRLLTPVARALERAHRFSGPDGPTSIVHRDLKPENLFIAQVAGEEVVKILGFGIGKVKSVASQEAGRVSEDGNLPIAFTPAYGAPEQWAPRHYGQTGPWTDVWGLALCMVEVMAARTVIEGDPATMMGIALDPKRRPTPRNEGIEVADEIEAVFERALALDPRARQRDAGVFWNELLAALARTDAPARPVAVDPEEDLEFDPMSARLPAAHSLRGAAPYRVTLGVSTRASAPPRAPANDPAPTAPMRAAAISASHFVPDLDLTPAPVSRRASGERPAVHAPAVKQPSLIDLEDSVHPAGLSLDLDLPADEPRPQRTVSSHGLAAVRVSPPPPSNPSTSGTAVAGSSNPELKLTPSDPPRSGRVPLAPRVASVDAHAPGHAHASVAVETGFMAKIDPKLLQERTLTQRLRPAIALLAAAVLVALLDPIYAAASGEMLSILGLRLSLFAGVLLLLSLGFALRELTRESE